MKLYILTIFNFILVIVSFVCCMEIQKKSDKRYMQVVTAFEQTQECFDYQNKLIEQYKRDCEIITEKVINGEW